MQNTTPLSGTAAEIAPVADLREYERRLRAAGLPLLIEDYSAREDVFTRAVPLFALVFVLEAGGAVDRDWPLLANVGAVAGGVLVLLLGVAVLNRLSGRPWTAVPSRFGATELAAFVLVPALLPLIFGGQVTSALVTAAGNLLLVALVYGVIGYGVPSIVAWAGRRLAGQLAASLLLLTRAIPLLLFFALLIFLTVEMWEVFASGRDALLGVVAALLVLLGSLFLAVLLPREVRRIEREVGSGPALDRRQRLNVALVMFIAQALQVLVVSVAVGAFFVALGALMISPELQEEWSGSPGEVLVSLELLGSPVELTVELLRVAGAIAAFSGLYYAIAVLTDSVYRAEFLEELEQSLRDTFVARADYLRLRAQES
jgi:hypothetical protein